MANTKRRQRTQAGFTLTEVLVSVAIVGITAVGVGRSLKQYFSSLALVRSTEKIGEFEQQLPNILWMRLSTFLVNQGVGICNLSQVPAALNNTPIGAYGSLQNQALTFGSPGTAAQAALNRCASPHFPGDGGTDHTYFCLQLTSAGGAPAESFFGDGVEAFMEVGVSFRNVLTNAAISCATFNNGATGDPAQYAAVYVSVYWHHLPLQPNSDKERDLVLYGISADGGDLLWHGILVPEPVGPTEPCALRSREAIGRRGRHRGPWARRMRQRKSRGSV